MEMYDKEAIYDEKINPLMAEIIKICKENQIHISDEEIAKEIYCDIRTVRRHRSRLVQVLAIWFYGADAV